MFGTSNVRQRGMVLAVFGGIVLIGVLGCSKEPFTMIPVRGKVTYEDGSVIPAKQIRVEFVPQVEMVNAATHPRPGMTYLNVDDGTFASVTSHKADDGLVVGKHKVVVVSLDERENQTNAVPKSYAAPDTTPLEIEVNGETKSLELKVKKP